jgi:hypothetical protein
MLLLVWAALPPSAVRAAIDTDTHDPSIIKHGNYYYHFVTNGNAG